jgi:monoterpene epsilon-lactone hydrolase
MPSIPFYFYRPLMRLSRWYQNRLAGRGINALLEFRQRSDWLADRFMSIPGGIQIRETHLGGVPASWLLPEVAAEDPVLLFFHGGSNIFTWGTPHRRLVSRLAIYAGLPVLGLDFRLAPAYPYPAAHDDCFKAYQALVEEGKGIVLVGESSGGMLALSTMLRAREAGLPQPLLAGFISPLVDYFGADLSIYQDAFVHPDFVTTLNNIYLDGYDLANTDCCPISANLQGLPPLYIMVGEREILRGETDRLVEKALQDGLEVEICLWPHVWHGWHVLAPQLPEATRALESFGRNIARIVATNTREEVESAGLDPGIVH